MNKQIEIEKMGKVIAIPCYVRINAYGDGSKECPSPIPCNECTAELLYKAGYRKASDVAREIVEFLFRRSKALQNTFKDNPDSAQCFRGRFELENAATIIANEYGVELKKKYESEGADDDVPNF